MVRDDGEVIARLEAQTFHLQRKYAELLREFQRLKQPPLIVGTVVDVFEDRAVVRHPNGNQFLVPVTRELIGKVKPGDRVALAQQNLALVEILPPERDERVRAFEIEERPPVRYEDIGGLKNVIEELREVVELPLKRPDLFKEIGVEPPKGVLLYGPPGTGKTLLAKAVAGESDATFVHVVASELVQKYIGEGAKLVRDLFSLVRERAPSILFIDEIDAIGGIRINTDSGGEREIHRTLMQLLAEMDGFKPLEGVVVMAATNRPDILDPALLRPGRFDKQIYVPPPDKEARKEIFEVYLRKVKKRGINLDLIAEKTEGMTGADIKKIVTDAALRAVKEGRTYVTTKDILAVIEKKEKEINPHVG